MVLQWLGLRASTAGGTGSIPGRGTKIPICCVVCQKKVCAGRWGEHPVNSSSGSRISLSSPHGKMEAMKWAASSSWLDWQRVFTVPLRLPGCGAVWFACHVSPCDGLVGGCPWAGTLPVAICVLWLLRWGGWSRTATIPADLADVTCSDRLWSGDTLFCF